MINKDEIPKFQQKVSMQLEESVKILQKQTSLVDDNHLVHT